MDDMMRSGDDSDAEDVASPGMHSLAPRRENNHGMVGTPSSVKSESLLATQSSDGGWDISPDAIHSRDPIENSIAERTYLTVYLLLLLLLFPSPSAHPRPGPRHQPLHFFFTAICILCSKSVVMLNDAIHSLEMSKVLFRSCLERFSWDYHQLTAILFKIIWHSMDFEPSHLRDPQTISQMKVLHGHTELIMK